MNDSNHSESMSCPRKRASIFCGSRVALALITLGFFFISCSSTKPVVKNNKQPSKPSSTQQQLLPDRWADSTEISVVPGVKKLFVNHDNSAVIIVREFYADDSTRKMIAAEDICMIARISMQLKIGERSGERRVTRVPERINGNGKFCSYVYEEKGLLRHVIVFKNGSGFFECEALQERSSLDFDSLKKDQMGVVKMVLKSKIFNAHKEAKR